MSVNDNQSSFFSMDRLVDFGIGMAMSQQIVNSMNNMMANIKMPPQLNQPQQSYSQIPMGTKVSTPVTSVEKVTVLPEVYYVVLDDKQQGPFSGTEIARLVMEKKVMADTFVWKTAMSEWKKASDFPELLALISMVPPQFKTE